MLPFILLMQSLKNVKIIVDGEEFNIPHKRIRVDVLLEKVGLIPGKDRLMLIDVEHQKITEFCCLADTIEIFEDMCFYTCK